MADMGDISAILGLLASEPKEGENADNVGSETQDEGIFGSIDADMIIKLIEVFSKLNENDKNTNLLYALKPHLRQENQSKVDMAASLMKIFSIMSIFGDKNMFL